MATGVLLGLRLILCGVLAVAGLAKLADRDGSARAVTDFGAPRALAAVLGVALPIVELVVAAGLLTTAAVVPAAVACLALLVGFCVAIAAAMRRGEAPECHCFGQLQSSPAGPLTLVRNAVLAAAAGAVLVGALDGRVPSATRWIAGLDTVEAVSVATAAASLGLALAASLLARELLRAHGRVLLRLDALEQGTEPGAGPPAEAFELEDVGGRRRSLRHLLAPGRPVLLIFSDVACGPCRALMGTLGGWQERLRGRVDLVVVATGDPALVRAEAAEHGVGEVLLAEDRSLHLAYDAAGTPTAVLVGQDGRRVGRPAGGQEAIERLMASLAPAVLEVVPPRPAPGLAPGTPAPPLELPLADGGTLIVPDGEPTLLVFWNPGCGFCRQMAEPLRAAAERAAGPRVVLVARGDVEANRTLTPDLPIALDPTGAAATAYGAHGTPIGVMVGADGRVASATAVGADATLALT